jgi:hypothetical protein
VTSRETVRAAYKHLDNFRYTQVVFSREYATRNIKLMIFRTEKKHLLTNDYNNQSAITINCRFRCTFIFFNLNKMAKISEPDDNVFLDTKKKLLPYTHFIMSIDVNGYNIVLIVRYHAVF